MNKQIWKYQLTLSAADNVHIMPKNRRILKIAKQDNGIFMWVLVDPKNEHYEYRFSIFGTGWQLPDTIESEYEYLDTIVMDSGLVWHIFEREVF